MARSGSSKARQAKASRRRPVVERKVVIMNGFQRIAFESQRADWEKAVPILLALGGEKVVVPAWADGDLREVIRRGRSWPGEDVELVPGEPSRCHENVAQLARERRGRVATGYALSTDGYWRQHSWLVGAAGRVIETTTARAVYFGVLLSEEESLRFTALQPAE